MTASAGRPAFSRVERFDRVGSTNDVVRGWLAAGTPEVCVAVADEQTAGRGRTGRTWTAPPGAALLLSLGFRPTWLAPERAWRLAATVALAMADAAEDAAGLPDGAVRLKWPNDLVIETGVQALLVGELSARCRARLAAARAAQARRRARREPGPRLGRPARRRRDRDQRRLGRGRLPARARRHDDEPARGLAPAARSTATELLDAFLGAARGPDRGAARRRVRRRAAGPSARSTTGRLVRLDDADGDGGAPVRALGVDAALGRPGRRGSGRRRADEPGERLVHAGEVTRVRLAPAQV